MENPLRIRAVDSSNIGELITIAEETNLSPWTALHYHEEMKIRRSIMLRLIDDTNSTVGFIIGRKVIGGDVHPRVDAEIYNIAVSPAFQRCGYGQLLLDAFKDICRQSNVKTLWLEVRESNVPAITFYKRNGFTRVQTRNNFYDNPREHAILMRADLRY